MIVKWKLAAVLVAACIGLGGFGTWRGGASPAATAADAPKAPGGSAPAKATADEAKPPAGKPAEPVATIFGNVPISRESFADHLIRRYGKKELELFVNKQVIAHAFAQQGWKITPAEIEAHLDETCETLKMTRAQLANETLKSQGRTLEAWTEDAVVPLMMLTRLSKAKISPVTEAELRRAFDLKCGEKLDCRVIAWGEDQGDEARRAYEKVRASEKEFDTYARRWQQSGKPRSGVAADGRCAPIPRARPFEEDEQAIHAAVAKLQPGEVSELVPIEREGNKGFIVVKCDKVIPADKDASFAAEKPKLLTDVLNAKVNAEVPKLFKELKQKADPKYHLTFPDPVAVPKPIPTKP